MQSIPRSNIIVWELLNHFKKEFLAEAMLDETPPSFSEKCIEILSPLLDTFTQRYFLENKTSQEGEVKERKILSNFMSNASNFFFEWKKQIDIALDNQDNKVGDKNIDSFIIRANDKEKILLQLANIGITPMVVYPDLKGTIEHINNKYK